MDQRAGSDPEPATGEREPATGADFVLVAIDAEGSPVAVPDLTVDSRRGESLAAAARED